LKRCATGMRLQALKDVGIGSVADLQGWTEYRVSQVRGVGPKSATAIVEAVAIITAATKAIPVDHPAPPYSSCTERQLIQALYRRRWFDTHITEQSNKLMEILNLHHSARDEVVTKTNFTSWLWKFGSNKTIRKNINRANAMLEALEAEDSRSLRDKLSTSLCDCRTLCANHVPIESIIQDFSENQEFYDSWLTNWIGRPGSKAPAKPMPEQRTPNTPLASDFAHRDFGRVVPVPPPQPIGESRVGSALSETPTQQPGDLVSVSIGSHGQPTEFTLPVARRVARSKDLRWLARGESIQIQGHTLPHGFVYVGKAINFEQHYALDPSLSGKAGVSTQPDMTGYYFNYAALTQEQRSQYLDWLAAGGSSSAESGHGMLYFYGLERRVLDHIQGKISNPLEHELDRLLEEVHRLGISSRRNQEVSHSAACALQISRQHVFSMDPLFPNYQRHGIEPTNSLSSCGTVLDVS
jgi:hypothetical protein